MTHEELEQIAETEREAQKKFTHTVNVCVSTGCMSAGSQAVKDAITQEIKKQGREHSCHAKGVGCLGLCAKGPLVATGSGSTGNFSTGGGVLYKQASVNDVPEIVAGLDGNAVSRLVCRTDVPFFQRQKKIVLENAASSIPNGSKTTSPPTATCA